MNIKKLLASAKQIISVKPANSIKLHRNNHGLPIKPKTFQQKIQYLNDPRTIQKLELVEFGFKYIKPNMRLTVLLIALGVLIKYTLQQVPEKVIDTYFTISNIQLPKNIPGILLSPFVFESNIYYYIPMYSIFAHMTRFISQRWIALNLGINIIVNGCLGKYLVNQRVKQYEIWDQERVSNGEGTLMSMCTMFLAALGFKNGVNSFKSRIFFQAIPGLGMTKKGINSIYILMAYVALQFFLKFEGKKNVELTGTSCFIGAILGLMIRRFSPLK